MGIDAKLFVLAPYGPYVVFTFTLERERDLWEPLEALQKGGRVVPSLQLPAGSWCWFDGEERPAERSNQECGYLSSDNYGQEFRSFKGSRLAGLTSEYPINTAILQFVATNLPTHDVVVFWT